MADFKVLHRIGTQEYNHTHRLCRDSVLYPEAKSPASKAMLYAYDFWCNGKDVMIKSLADHYSPVMFRLSKYNIKTDGWFDIRIFDVQNLHILFITLENMYGMENMHKVLSGQTFMHGNAKLCFRPYAVEG